MKTNFIPDFEQLLRVLRRERPDRPVLFEFYLNDRLYKRFHNGPVKEISTFFALGYDYATIKTHDLILPMYTGIYGESISQNKKIFKTRADFEAFPWKDPDLSIYKEQIGMLSKLLPKGGKFIGCQPQSVLGGLITGFGYENLCILCYDDSELVKDAADAIGSKLLIHAEIMSSFDCVGAIILNDDWGFSSQTRLSPIQMQKFILPWYAKMVEAVHSHGKPVILHSCGNMWALIDDICDVCKFDGKHSYEDKILPVEVAYKKYGSKLAILGGIDVDFLARNAPAEIKSRANDILDLTDAQGGYALGSGNSIPEYIPDDNYLAMISAAWERR